jgi:uncharacterized protein (TIGR03067 family)
MNQVCFVRFAALLILAAFSLGPCPSYAQKGDNTAPPKEAPGKGDREELVGTWKVTSVKTVDVPRPFSRQDYSKSEAEFEKATCRITAEKISVQVGKEVREAAFTVDTGKTPKEMDFKAQLFPHYQKEVTSLAIYEVKADRLKICFGPGKSARPAAFGPSDKDGQLFVFVIELRREPEAKRKDEPAKSRK